MNIIIERLLALKKKKERKKIFFSSVSDKMKENE